MKLTDLFPNERGLDFSIEKVKYHKKSGRLDFYLSARPEEWAEERKKEVENKLEERFYLPSQLIFLAPSPVPSYYEKPICLPKGGAAGKEEVESKEGISIGRLSSKDREGALPLSEVEAGEAVITSYGQVFGLESYTSKKGQLILNFKLGDHWGGAISCHLFVKEKDRGEAEKLKNGLSLLIKGKYQYDSYAGENTMAVRALEEIEGYHSKDPAKKKRVELAVHTQMSNMEGLIRLGDLKKRLKEWGHTAFGVTDKGSVQAYPAIYKEFKDSGIKAVYGYEAKFLRDDFRILTNSYGKALDSFGSAFTVFDIETTGFSRFNDRIIEIGAIRYEEGRPVGRFSEFVDPKRPIPERITELTSITDAMVQGAPTIDVLLPRFFDFARDSIFVGHNADFDMGFMIENAHRLQLPFEPVYMDTLELSHCLHPDWKNYKLDTMAKNLNAQLAHHHRAIDDAEATGRSFIRLMKEWEREGLPLERINQTPSSFPISRHLSYSGLIYVKNQAGLKNLYRLVSLSNIGYFYRTAGIPWSELEKNREGLLLLSGQPGSALFEGISRRLPDERLEEIAGHYDALVVYPPSYTEKALLTEEVEDRKHYQAIVEKILEIGERTGKAVLAMNAPFYLDKGQKMTRNILVNYQRKIDFEREEHYRLLNTQEMLDQFSFLPREKAEEVVVEAPCRLVEAVDEIVPIPQGTYTPNLEGAEEELWETTHKRAAEIYGDPLPGLVKERLERELNSIISNGYASLYVIAQKLVKKSNDDGYIVGSRGSVGSSFAATMSDITEVNPLPPHYVCPSCQYSEFIEDGSVDSGFDLPPKNCPRCGQPLRRDGHTIPFQVFLGFNGDKEPDIDLNFAGDYMPIIHKYTEVLFGRGKVYRAGTISGVQTKTAYGYIRKYLEQPYIPEEDRNISEARIQYLQADMEGTRRTTGQHAGGLIIVPKEYDILDFTPVQYPADDPGAGVTTTHFTYDDLKGHMLKLDELGHTSPTVLKQLQRMTDKDPLTISFDDEETMSIFSSTEALKAVHPYSNADQGTLGIPEFGTGFVRGMLADTKPKTFGELIRISGLSHGTDVWLNNAQDLVRKGTITLSQAICTRDDIMNYLLSKNMDKLLSFKTMEAVRHGRGIPEEALPKMKEGQIPDWFIDSCQKIKYMFPKAHATAYVMMSFRIAWFKVHMPAAFYANYYSQHLSDFSQSYLFQSLSQAQQAMEDHQKERDSMSEANFVRKTYLLEIIEEMLARDIHFSKVDLKTSPAADFTILDDKTVLPPLSAVENVSPALGEAIVAEREKGEFLSQKDFKDRTAANRSAMESLRRTGLLDFLPKSNQLSFFPGF